jgi:hypothetical protein
LSGSASASPWAYADGVSLIDAFRARSGQSPPAASATCARIGTSHVSSPYRACVPHDSRDRLRPARSRQMSNFWMAIVSATRSPDSLAPHRLMRRLARRGPFH